MASSEKQKVVWEKVLDTDELPEGRVKPVTCEHRTFIRLILVCNSA